MAWEARRGLKRILLYARGRVLMRLNGLGSPSGIETLQAHIVHNARVLWLNSMGSPYGIETSQGKPGRRILEGLNGLGSPSGIETKPPIFDHSMPLTG